MDDNKAKKGEKTKDRKRTEKHIIIAMDTIQRAYDSAKDEKIRGLLRIAAREMVKI